MKAPIPPGPPADLIVRLTPQPRQQSDAATGVTVQMRQPQAIAALLPQVLARYGLGNFRGSAGQVTAAGAG